MEGIRAQNQEAWVRLVALYTPLVHHWCRHWGVRGDDADDVVQEVFQAVAIGMRTFRYHRSGDTFRGWLRAITRNKLLDTYRRSGSAAQGGSEAYQRFLDLPDPFQEPPADTGEVAVDSLFHRALELVRGEFEERTWQTFWLVAVEGQAPTDVAADLGITAAAVRQAKSRILRRLKDAIGDLPRGMGSRSC
jgi:RNA polymerase sigma-70 factor (ECF subfamily)